MKGIHVKKVFQSLLVVSIAIVLHGCGYTKPSAELMNFMGKVYNILFSFGYFIILFGILRTLWGKTSKGTMIIFLGVVFLSSAYIAFVLFTVFYPGYIELVIPFI